MKKVIFIICILGATALGFANNSISYDKLTVQASYGESDRTSVAASISAGINGHNLTVSFSQNIGEVSIEITSLSGETIYNVLIQTPAGQLFYIPASGSYVVTFTLQNGGEYYGEFEVIN